MATGPDEDVGGCEVDPAVEVPAGGADDMAAAGGDDRTIEPGEGPDDADLPCALFPDDPPVDDRVSPVVGPASAVTIAESAAELIDPDPAGGLGVAPVPEHPASVTATAAAATIALVGMCTTPPA